MTTLSLFACVLEESRVHLSSVLLISVSTGVWSIS